MRASIRIRRHLRNRASRGPAWAPRRVIAVLLAGAAVLGACGDPKYRYVKHSSDGIYFRLPHSWATYSEDEWLEAQDTGLDDTTLDAFRQSSWVVGFDGGDDPSVDHVIATVSDSPTGVALVRDTTEQERDELSLKGLRNLIVPVDDLLDKEQADMRSYEELDLADGFRGARTIVTVDTDEGTFVLDQTAAINDDASKEIGRAHG